MPSNICLIPLKKTSYYRHANERPSDSTCDKDFAAESVRLSSFLPLSLSYAHPYKVLDLC